MAIKTVSKREIQYALDQTGIEYGEISDTYQGRGMGYDACLSIIFAGKRIQRDLCRFFVELAISLDTAPKLSVDDVTNLAAVVSTDDLGLDMIVYFPGWKLAD